jgi:tetraacyldisaccharide 4'-kinase
VVVSDGVRVLADYELAGDEPLMLARQLPGCAVVVSPDRYLAGALAERRLGCAVHVLDDGFQHLQLARTLDIVVVRRRDLDDRVMPFGRLREPIETMASADAVVVDADDEIDDAVVRVGARQLFRMSRHLGPAAAEPAFAFAGIGRPGEFFDALRTAAGALSGLSRFQITTGASDAEMARLVEQANRAGARVLVTTEKDAARLRDSARALPVVAVPLTLTVEPASEFAVLLEQACTGHPR